MLPSYPASPEEQEKSNEAAGFPAGLGNIGICAAILEPQGRNIISSGRNRLSWTSQFCSSMGTVKKHGESNNPAPTYFFIFLANFLMSGKCAQLEL